MSLSAADLDRHATLGIDAELLARAGVRRGTDRENRELLGLPRHRGDLAGVVYPRIHPATGRPVGYRIRRDNPEIEAGKPRAKYLSSIDRAHLYFPPAAGAWLGDVTVPVALMESEKATLALAAAAQRAGRRVLPIGLGGAWGWKARIGKTTSATGARVDEHGPSPDLDLVTWRDRDVIIMLDGDARTNRRIGAARRALAEDLIGRGARVRIVDLPIADGINGPDDYIGAHGDATFWALVDGARPPQDRDESAGRGPSQATHLVDLALASGVECWHAPNGDAFATVVVGTHREHHPLRRVVRDYLARLYYTTARRSASSAALTDALGTLGGMARYDGPTYGTAVRLAEHHGTIYLDLGDSEWQAIAIDAAGYRVVSDAPVRHWRPSGLRALPLPVAGGTLDHLREIWRLDEDTWTLIASWLVATVAPRGPYPILTETGEQGSGKSTLGRMLRGVIDPASPELRGVPRDERDVMIGALTSHVVALDNLSGLPAWLSDALCRIATGGGLATRTLYSDLDETLIDVSRPILLTGIEQPATRGDLLDRALVVSLPAMSDEARGDETDLWARYAAMRPALLGALCSAASMALRGRAAVRLDRRPRMADSCTWVTAAEPALGWVAGRTVTAWTGARAQASADLVAGDPVAHAILGLPLASPWQGTAAELLDVLTRGVADSVRTRRAWPTSARGLAGALRRLAPDLRRVGVAVDLPTSARTARERIITIRQGCKTQDRSDTSDTDADSLNVSADSARPVACPVGPTGHPTGHQKDSDPTNESGPLSDVSDLSCPAQPDQVDRLEVDPWSPS